MPRRIPITTSKGQTYDITTAGNVASIPLANPKEYEEHSKSTDVVDCDPGQAQDARHDLSDEKHDFAAEVVGEESRDNTTEELCCVDDSEQVKGCVLRGAKVSSCSGWREKEGNEEGAEEDEGRHHKCKERNVIDCRKLKKLSHGFLRRPQRSRYSRSYREGHQSNEADDTCCLGKSNLGEEPAEGYWIDDSADRAS